jgi:hypothetical protein
MTIFEKINTERHRRDINLCRPVSQPDATGFSGTEPDATDAKPSAFFADCPEEHSAPEKSVPIAKSIAQFAAEKPAQSKDKEA